MTPEKIFRHGASIYLTTSDGWKSEVFQAYLQPVRYKNKVYLEGDYTEIGVNDNDVFIYLGPSNHDLTKLPRDTQIHDLQRRKFMIDKSERVIVNGETFYIWATVRQIQEVN